MKNFEIKHIELKAANAFVAEYHRHHRPVTGHRFSLGCVRREDQALCGVAIVGRPLARKINDETTVGVLRLCTEHQPEGCGLDVRLPYSRRSMVQGWASEKNVGA